MAGQCRAPLGIDGCSGAARDISLGEVSAYQTIKIPLTKGITAIAAKDRVVSVVQGRDTMFRVFVTPATGFRARELSARVTISNGATPTQYFAKQMISAASTDASTASTFQVPVPASAILPDTRYSVELVECGDAASAAAPAGMLAQPRFPVMGDVALEARQTGVLKIMVIPLVTNAHSPDTTEKTLAVYKSYLEAMYPIEEAQITVGKELSIAYPVSWDGTLDRLRQLRAADRPPADLYYYGLLKPTDTFRAYCGSGCTAGIGYVGAATQAATRVAMGLAFADEVSASTMAHELGHNHGRNHAPCAPGNRISGVDSKYPYQRAITNTWGYDERKQTLFSPDKTTDIMGYCEPKWISDYTYKALIERVASLNGATLTFYANTNEQAYRVLLVDESGPRWSQPFTEPAEPFGDAEYADAL
ncbi:MAG: hypothetical protein RL701_7216, partial [Pseudomonadota bacterium]